MMLLSSFPHVVHMHFPRTTAQVGGSRAQGSFNLVRVRLWLHEDVLLSWLVACLTQISQLRRPAQLAACQRLGTQRSRQDGLRRCLQCRGEHSHSFQHASTFLQAGQSQLTKPWPPNCVRSSAGCWCSAGLQVYVNVAHQVVLVSLVARSEGLALRQLHRGGCRIVRLQRDVRLLRCQLLGRPPLLAAACGRGSRRSGCLGGLHVVHHVVIWRAAVSLRLQHHSADQASDSAWRSLWTGKGNGQRASGSSDEARVPLLASPLRVQASCEAVHWLPARQRPLLWTDCTHTHLTRLAAVQEGLERAAPGRKALRLVLLQLTHSAFDGLQPPAQQQQGLC